MQMRTLMRTAALCLLASSLAGPAFATEPLSATNGEFGLNFGTLILDVSSDQILEGGNAYRLDARAGYMITDHFEIEGQYIVAFNSGDDVDTDFDMLFVNGLFNFHPSPATMPYLMVGVGQMNADYEFLGTVVSDDNDSYQLGVGSRFFFGDERGVATRIELSAISAELFNDDSFHFSITTGITWRIGRQR